MNRQQAKDLLPIIQGYVDGKKIEKRPKGRYDVEWQETDLPAFNAHTCDYRIKPEPKYRPFKDAEECWQDYNYMFNNYTFADGTPFGIKEK